MAQNQKKTPTLPLHEEFQAAGLEFRGLAENGNPLVFDPTVGKVGEYPLHEDLAAVASEGIDPKSINVVLNTPDSPLPTSPVTLEDRAKLQSGNTKGSIRYLKKSFEDAKFHPEHGLVVKKQGAWHAVDPSSGVSDWIKDPYEFTKDVVDTWNEALDFGSSVAAGAAGAVAGPVGAVAGRIAGQGASSAAQVYLGKLWGTYEATNEEALQDIGLDMLLAAGGEAIAPGVAPGVKQLVKAAGKIKQWGGDAAVAAWSGLSSKLTGVTSQAMNQLLTKAPVVTKTISSLGKEARKNAGKAGVQFSDVQQVAKMRMNGLAEQILERADKALPNQYRAGLRALATNPKTKTLSLDSRSMVKELVDAIDQSGALKVAADPKTGKLVARALEGAETLADDFIPASDDVAKAFTKIINDVDAIARQNPSMKGPQAAKALVRINELLSNSTKRLIPQGDATAKAVVARLGQTVRNSVQRRFKEAGLGAEFDNLMAPYQRYTAAVSEGRRLLKSDRGVEAFTDQLIKDFGRKGSKVAPLQMTGDLVELLGDDGIRLYDEIMTNHAAAEFAKIAPRFSLVQTLALGGGAAATVGALPAAAAVLGAPVLAQSSRRFVAAQAAGAQRVSNTLRVGFGQLSQTLKGMAPAQLRELAKNPNVLTSAVDTIAASDELRQFIEQKGVELATKQ